MTGTASQPPVRTLHLEGEEWVVQVSGQTRSGSGSDSGAPLLYLVFAPASAPGVWAREAIAVAVALDDLSDADLESLFARARPYRSVAPARSVAADRSAASGRPDASEVATDRNI